uniref:CKLF-like MARVEL transmembrane domain containing 7 n=1 Tax=Astyanax mexicanus TaxID=7994 RepID=A0A8B9JXC5_ASTMX
MSHTVVTTRTTTTTTSSSSADGGFLNLGYIRTFPGLLKLAQVVTLLIAFLCIHCAPGWTDLSAFRYFEVVTVWFLIAFLIFLLMYILRLQSKIPCINWTLTVIYIYKFFTFCVFGFIATFLLAISLWTSYKVTCGSQPTSKSHSLYIYYIELIKK